MSGLVMPDGTPVPTLPPAPAVDPPVAETAPAPAPEAPEPVDPRDSLTIATQIFFGALAAGAKVPIETVTGALEGALQALAAQHADKLPGVPVAGVDYEILATPAQDKLPADVRINGLTQLGDMLGALWQGYQHEVEYVAVKGRVALLSAIAQRQEDVIRSLQTQIDNVMLDVAKIRKKVGA